MRFRFPWLAFALLVAVGNAAPPAEQRIPAALSEKWMVAKLPLETPAAYLARLLDSARDGDSRATCALGWEFHLRGDDLRARTWLGKSAERENLLAAYLLGLLAPPKPTDGPDDALEVDWMKRAAEGGLADAQFEMALRYVQGKGVAVDLPEARRWYRLAAAQQLGAALCNLGTMEMQGAGGPVDLPAAAQHFRTAADAGVPQGMFGMAEVLRMQSRYADAAAAYRRAAAAGIVDADFWLGSFAREGIGQAPDEKEAAQHFLAAALGGHVLSQAIAADILRRGAGVPIDVETAAHWDAEVAKQTNPEVTALIGSFYLEGRLVQRDFAKALQFFRSAAERGHPAAQRWAGALLASGEAGERNLTEAYQWLWLAARHGQTDAEPAFQAVLQAMDGKQIMEAAKRAADFQPAAP